MAQGISRGSNYRVLPVAEAAGVGNAHPTHTTAPPRRRFMQQHNDRAAGGLGDDVILGGHDDDDLRGGPGQDFVDGFEGSRRGTQWS